MRRTCCGLRSLTRTYRTPRVFDERISLKGYGNTLIRQLSILDLGHEEPTLLLTNDLNATPSHLITRYAQRMLIENGIAEAIHFRETRIYVERVMFNLWAYRARLGQQAPSLTALADSRWPLYVRQDPGNER